MTTTITPTLTTEQQQAELRAQLAAAEARRDRHSRDARTAWQRYHWHKVRADREAENVARLRDELAEMEAVT